MRGKRMDAQMSNGDAVEVRRDHKTAITWAVQPLGLMPMQGLGATEYEGQRFTVYFRFRSGLGFLELKPENEPETFESSTGDRFYAERQWRRSDVERECLEIPVEYHEDELIFKDVTERYVVDELVARLRPFREWEFSWRMARFQ